MAYSAWFTTDIIRDVELFKMGSFLRQIDQIFHKIYFNKPIILFCAFC